MATTLSPVSAGAKGASGGEGAEAPKKSKKKLMIIVLVVLLVVGGAAYKFVLAPKPKPSGPPKPVKGAVVKLDDISLNLANGHFLKLGIALQQTKKASAEFDGSEATDIAISEFSGMKMEDLSVASKREAAKEDYLKKVEKAYPDEVMDVYFTDFVMQ